jgi:hypothetical protein
LTVNVKQYYLGCLSHASYLITDDKTKTAAVVDPQRDIEQYLADAAAGGYQIKHVFLTHFHADFLAGHIELRNRAGAKIYLGRRAEAEFDFVKVKEGDQIEFGDVRLGILETPGHTPEGISILVYDLAKDPAKPFAVRTSWRRSASRPTNWPTCSMTPSRASWSSCPTRPWFIRRTGRARCAAKA